jgi:hypothetical protein
MYGRVPSPIDQALYLIRQHYRKTVPEGEDNNTYSTYLFLEIKNQRLPGACNRSPGSKLLSITTQLHCGGHLGGKRDRRTQFWKRTIPSKFGSN